VYEFGSARLRAKVASRGAELLSLLPTGKAEMLWQRDPDWWDYTAPLLFPIIGKPVGIRMGGISRSMNSHGFAREKIFKRLEAGPDNLTLTLESDDVTDAMYPYRFRLTVRYRIHTDTIGQEVIVKNTGPACMPASFGFHPALAWPLCPADRCGYALSFNRSETGPLYRVNDAGSMEPASYLAELSERRLTLHDGLFAQGALVIGNLNNSELILCSSAGVIARIGWRGCSHLGLWSLPGAPFVCIEPWFGHPSPIGFDGDLLGKPGAFLLQAGQERAFGLSITALFPDGHPRQSSL